MALSSCSLSEGGRPRRPVPPDNLSPVEKPGFGQLFKRALEVPGKILVDETPPLSTWLHGKSSHVASGVRAVTVTVTDLLLFLARVSG